MAAGSMARHGYSASPLYGMVLVIWGIILPIATYSHQADFIYVSIFGLYIDGVSLCGVIVLLVFATKAIPDETNKQINDSTSQVNQSFNHENNLSIINGTTTPPKRKSSKTDPEKPPPVVYGGVGFSFYSRMGAIAFGIGQILLDVFRLYRFAEMEKAMQCYGIIFIFHCVSRFFFTVLQTYFLFKCHQVVFYAHKNFVRFILIHIIATNLCNWATAVVSESVETFYIVSHTDSRGRRAAAPYVPSPTSNYTGTESSNICHSHDSSTILAKASHYLFPFAIEYCLIAASGFDLIYTKVGKKIPKHLVGRQEPSTRGVSCHRAAKGLFLGLFIVLLTLLSFVAYYAYKNNTTIDPRLTHISVYIRVIINCLGTIGVIVAMCQFTKLLETDTHEAEFDAYLLVLAATGVYLIRGFSIVSAVGGITTEGQVVNATATLIKEVSEYIQISLQIGFILDGLKRRAKDEEQLLNKPGRSAVTFLLVMNLCVWALDSFEVSALKLNDMHVMFYGTITWTLIYQMCKPLAIFFRFHSTVCLADIWVTTYVLAQKEDFEEEHIPDSLRNPEGSASPEGLRHREVVHMNNITPGDVERL